MRSKDDLHHLIQAMSKSEKRYFVLDAKKSGRSASRYLSLFDTINAMEEYDEEALKKKFLKNLSSDKAYLYEAILRSMRDYRSKSSKAAQVKERLMDAKYLYERGLYQQSGDRIMEAKALAKELEDNFSLLEIIREEQLSLFDRRVRVGLEQIEKLNKEGENALIAIDEELKYLDLYYRLLLEILREFNLKDKSSVQALNQRLPLNLLDEKNKPLSPQAEQRFFQCNAVYYNLLGDVEKVHQFYLKAVEWWQKYPVLKDEEYHRYINNIHNLLNASYKLEKQSPSTKRWIDLIEREKSSLSYHNQKIIFRALSISNLLQLLNKNDFENAKKMLPEIIEGINKFGLKRSIVLLGNIITVYFLVKDHRNCIKWTSYVIKTLKNDEREDIHRVIRLYKIIAFYELGEIEKAEADIRSFNRHFKMSHLSKNRFEFVVVNVHLKNIFNSPLGEMKKVHNEFSVFLNHSKNQPGGEMPLGIDELLIWINTKG